MAFDLGTQKSNRYPGAWVVVEAYRWNGRGRISTTVCVLESTKWTWAEGESRAPYS